jgi:hypothetical protein
MAEGVYELTVNNVYWSEGTEPGQGETLSPDVPAVTRN